MRRISTSIAVVLSTLLLVSICSAQQTPNSNNKQTTPGRESSPIGIEGPVIGGDGTRNFIPLWISPSYLLSSVLYQASGGNVGIGTTTPAAKLDVNGGINAGATYGIDGATVLSIGTPTDQNIFLGMGAGTNNVTGLGQYNTFFGYKAGYSNTNGFWNSFSGGQAGANNISGYYNTFSGASAGFSNISGHENVFSGTSAGFSNIIGDYNTFSGASAGFSNTNGGLNTFSGESAGYSNTTGFWNTFSGNQAGVGNTTGSTNSFYGYLAGFYNTTGSDDVYIASIGPSTGAESNAIRIGLPYSSDGFVCSPFSAPCGQNAAYIAGVYGSTSSSGVPVYINSDGLLGTQTSSLRFKEQVRDMGDSTNALMKLRPVTFVYKAEYSKGERTLQYGLIAEEVAKVYPELVANDQDGQPYTVRYQYITTMLLNEVQKQYRRAETQAEVIRAQEQKIDDLEQRLSRLERLVPESVAQK